MVHSPESIYFTYKTTLDIGTICDLRAKMAWPVLQLLNGLNEEGLISRNLQQPMMANYIRATDPVY
jgi:hypothetical protein